MRLRIHLLLILPLWATMSVSAQTDGTIQGTVLDEESRPLAAARVHIQDRNRTSRHDLIRFFETDADGHFVISHVPWGSYTVQAGKESDGYPDTKFAFYGNYSSPTVSLAPPVVTQTVTVRMAPRAGIINVNSVVNAMTWENIKSAAITLRRDANKDLFITASTTMGRLLAPSGVKIRIEIRAVGYEDWYYPGFTDASRSVPIELRPSEALMLDVKLQPKAP